MQFRVVHGVPVELSIQYELNDLNFPDNIDWYLNGNRVMRVPPTPWQRLDESKSVSISLDDPISSSPSSSLYDVPLKSSLGDGLLVMEDDAEPMMVVSDKETTRIDAGDSDMEQIARDPVFPKVLQCQQTLFALFGQPQRKVDHASTEKGPELKGQLIRVKI